MARRCTKYSSLLRWAIMRKVSAGMSMLEIEMTYGVPNQTVSDWNRRVDA